ncbi:hypothetical protein B0T22DRAFT_18566 [Podospora appendiculata]|uniref:Uncharacterized protein n=1 Tax=Podospora appendiculata TaxID=314037 RepID=A0AAE0XG16_9PEZI|nr:hypothetical protein B0T22DRAFT_18566 [Podospora appendiculata]
MAYLLYTLVLLTIISGTALYLTRAHWQPTLQRTVNGLDLRLPGRDYLYARIPTSTTFAGDAEAGLSSSTFDLSGNLADGDSRAGLDQAAKREILRIMQRRRLPFDEARRAYMEDRFKANGIGADGRPKDPKFVSFS